MALFNQVTIVGLGLMGGSLGMAIKRRRLARRVVGLSRHPSTLRRARACGAVDAGTTDLRRAVQDADLVVLATPVGRIVPLARRAARAMRAGSVLTDLGSAKGSIVSRLERALPSRVAWVGGHPLAGSEQHGIEAANADLFDGSVCVLTPTARTPRAALARVSRLWSALGVQVVTMSPSRHDRILAGTSHLPHLVAYALARAISVDPRLRAPRSLLEMTRIAKSSPALWEDVVLANRAQLLAAVRRFDRRWAALRAALVRSDRAALRRFFVRAQACRNALD